MQYGMLGMGGSGGNRIANGLWLPSCPAALAFLLITTALRGEKMAEAIREILEEQFPEWPTP